MKKVLFAASEGLPFVKSGGLADVVGSLSQALSKKRMEVAVMLPLYQKVIDKYFDQLTLKGTYSVNIAKYDCDVRLFETKVGKVTYYFIENNPYFEREGLYGYGDDGERFAFFSHAILKAIQAFDLYPDILHAHDWQTGMLAALCKTTYSYDSKLRDMTQIYTIHNLAYQGNFSRDMLDSCLAMNQSLFENGSVRFRDGISFMKSGIVFADKISTVSNTYSHEIMTPEYGEGLDQLLQYRCHDVWGIVNGLDLEGFDPQKDPDLYVNFGLKTLDKRVANKRSLQYELGLRESDDVCLVGMVTRLATQKGIQLVLDKMKDLMGLDIQLVILGTGEASYESDLRNCEHMYTRRMVYYGGYSDRIARKIYGGADLFIMPSHFEPCGLSQMIAMRYGCVPVVRETGGLKDTVAPYNYFDKTGTGFSFTHFNADDFYQVLRMAVDVFYTNKEDFRMLQVNGMKGDYSWKSSADLYLAMYKMAMNR